VFILLSRAYPDATSAASCCTFCPTASTASATPVSSPRPIVGRTSRASEPCCTPDPLKSPPTIRRRPAPNRRHTRLAKPSPSARIAAASCAVSASSPHRQPAPFNATRHDDNRWPALEPPRLATPPRHRAAGADPRRVIRSATASFAFDPVTTVVLRGVQTPVAARSNRSTSGCSHLPPAQAGGQSEPAPALSP
jgi:hypothetical protein